MTHCRVCKILNEEKKIILIVLEKTKEITDRMPISSHAVMVL